MKHAKQLTRLYLARVLYKSGFARQRALRRHSRPIVLAYHRIISDTCSDAEVSYAEMHVSPAHFSDHIDFLNKAGSIHTPEESADSLREAQPKQLRFVVTFDDGWRDNYTNAWPILRAHKVRAVLFAATSLVQDQDLYWTHKLLVLIRKHWSACSSDPKMKRFFADAGITTNFDIRTVFTFFRFVTTLGPSHRKTAIDTICKLFASHAEKGSKKRHFLSWSELVEMSGEGLVIGSHTVSHDPCTMHDPRQLSHEIEVSRNILERKSGRPTTLFAFPHSLYSDQCVRAVRGAGYAAAFAGPELAAPIFTQSHFALYPRVSVSARIYSTPRGSFSPSLFYCFLTGLFYP